MIEAYADLLQRGVIFFTGEYRFDSGGDACTIKCGDTFGLFLDSSRIKTPRQEKEAVVHEWVHITGNSTYRVDAPPAIRQKAEESARRDEIKKLLPFERMRGAIRGGITQIYELSEFFNVSEDKVREAIDYYTGPCGLSF